MNIEKIISSLPGQSAAGRSSTRANAGRLLQTGTADQKSAASELIAALDDLEQRESATLSEHVNGLPIARRVIEAFRKMPITENEHRTVQALLDNPGATSTELSRACGHDSMIWQMHFGNLCKDRQGYLWPAVKDEKRDAPFFSGILAEIDPGTNRFTMKADVVEAFGVLGLTARKSTRR